MRAPSGNHKLRRLTLVGTIASAVGTGCHDDGEPGGASTSSGHGGSSSSQPTNSGGSTQATTGGSTATSASAGGGSAGNGGAGGEPLIEIDCPDIAPPLLVTSVAEARSIGPTAFSGGESPLLDLDGPDLGFTYNDPHALRVGSQYWMYASATEFFDFPVRLYRLVSDNGVEWEREPTAPILDPGPPGSWDAGGVETPAVVFFNGTYHLFYTGYPSEVDAADHSVLDYRVGHATSCDGVHWIRDGASPVVAPSGGDAGTESDDWYAFVVAEPAPVVFHDQLYLYFTALGANTDLGTSLQVIGLTTSADGITWSAPELVLAPDQALYPRVIDPGPPLDGWVGYSTPNAMVLNDQLHLFFDVAYDPDEAHWRQIRLHHAWSETGIDDWQLDGEPLARAGDYDWAVDEVRSPSALIVDDELWLYFAGHELDGTEPDHFAIGRLTQPLLSH